MLNIFCFAIYFCLTLINCVLNEWLFSVLYKGEVLISCLLQLAPFSGQFVKLVWHAKFSLRWTWFPCTWIIALHYLFILLHVDMKINWIDWLNCLWLHDRISNRFVITGMNYYRWFWIFDVFPLSIEYIALTPFLW